MEIPGFTILQTLGQGVYGVVYMVESKSGKKYALKEYKSEEGVEDVAEISLCLQGKHPNLLRAFEYIKEKERHYLLLELAQEGLDRYLQDNVLNLDRKLELFYQAVSAVAYLHENNFVHCDIKKQNCLIMDGQLVLGDLGLGKPTFPLIDIKEVGVCQTFPSPQNYAYNESLVKGMEGLANEDVFFEKIDYRKGDVWALGQLFCSIFYGLQLYFDTPEDYDRFITDPNAYLDEIGFPDLYRDFVLRLLSPSQKNRPDVYELLNYAPLDRYDSFIPGTGPILTPRLNIQLRSSKYADVTVKWMNEVLEALDSEIMAVPTIEMFYYTFDYYTDNGKKVDIVQLLASACITLTSKLYKLGFISSIDMEYYTDYTYTQEQIDKAEEEVFALLNYRAYFNNALFYSESVEQYKNKVNSLLNTAAYVASI